MHLTFAFLVRSTLKWEHIDALPPFPITIIFVVEPEYKIEYRESLHHAAKDHTDRLLQNANNDEVEQHQVSESLYVKSLVNKGVIDQE